MPSSTRRAATVEPLESRQLLSVTWNMATPATSPSSSTGAVAHPARRARAALRTAVGAATLPGTIQAENFDTGGQGTAYLDTTKANLGGAYRTTERVDIYALSATNYAVGWTQAGEWLEYTVNAQQTAYYDATFLVGSSGPGGTFHLNVDGRAATSSLAVPATKRASRFATVSAGPVYLTAGQHVLRLVMDANGRNGDVGRFDSFTLTPLTPAAPTKLSASASASGISLTWRDNANNETAYLVQRSTNATTGWQTLTTLKANATSFTDASATAGSGPFYYRVIAVNGSLSSQPSGIASTVTAPVTGSPLVITKGGTYSGNFASNDPNTPAVQILTSQPVILQNSVITSRGTLIYVQGGGSVTVRNVTGYGMNPNRYNVQPGHFLDVNGFANLDVENNDLEGTAGIYAYNYTGNHTASQTVKILKNVAHNIDGRASDGAGGWLPIAENPDTYRQFFQADQLQNLVGAEVAWNQVINEQGKSRVEESINIFKTTGTAASPFRIHDNYIQGAFPANAADAADYSGGGIMVSDVGSAYIQAVNNQVVGTGGIGIEISSGHDNAIIGNRMVSAGLQADGSRAPWANTGGVIWNFNNESTFTNNVGHDNTIGWVNASGARNDYWIPDATQWYKNAALPNPITAATEANEFTLWQQKLAANGVTVGPS